MFSQLHLLNNALHGSAQNHNVLSQNIANINTPGYKTQQIQFEDFLRDLESNSDEPAEVTVETVQGLTERLDGNNVDLELSLIHI